MIGKKLNGNWNLKIAGKDAGLLPAEGIEAAVPGSVYSALLEKGLIPDPYYRENELAVLPLMDNDFIFSTVFTATEEMLAQDGLLIRFEGIDTLADLYLNDAYMGCACNMHRVWEYDLKKAGVKEGENRLKVVIHSPTQYIARENKKLYTGGALEAMEGFPHIRKAHCMFGWDWGPRIPDAGIVRDVTILGIKESRIDSVYITQKHETGKVTLDLAVALESFAEKAGGNIAIQVTAPNGRSYSPMGEAYEKDGKQIYSVEIEDPALWWPRGYGEQPLYWVKVQLSGDSGEMLDSWERRIGLRTLTMNTDQDQWGSCFAHEVNGVKIFAMGADYIPEDNLFSRITPERTRRLLEDAVWANHNCIRVWGGGYYPEDWFFDACDELGLIVWQDFMFACASYELDEEFEANITQEITENVRRIRHHASLGLWCGNNEMETQTLDQTWKPSLKQKYDYIKIFEYIIPNILKKEDPAAFYWPSSPSSGGNYDDPWSENRGDAHYWDVWHGNKPFTEYRKFYFRYLSEFGFQSFPSLKTVETFTEPADRNIFSRVMEMHQRNRAANGKILNYLSATYLYPGDFDRLLYASQLLQADAIRYGVEHFRRHRGRCMGTLVWQLNDIWPVASWSSIDYYGRYKALHYSERKMFAPLLLSCQETGELSERPHCIAQPAPMELSAQLHVANETRKEAEGVVWYRLRNPDSEVLLQGNVSVKIPPLSGIWLEKLELGDYDVRSIHLEYSLMVENQVVSYNTCLFTPPKHYYFQDPHLVCRREGSRIVVHADAYAKNVEIAGIDGDLWLSDNYFDMEKGEVTVEILRGDAKQIRVRSVYDIASQI